MDIGRFSRILGIEFIYKMASSYLAQKPSPIQIVEG